MENGIERHWQEYLTLVQLKESEMQEDERTELRLHFMGHLATTFALTRSIFRNKLSSVLVKKVQREMTEFWREQSNNLNTKMG